MYLACTVIMRVLSRTTTWSFRRQFFSLSSQPHRYQESKFFRYSQKELYEVVADVQSYHLFVPFCTQSRILSRRTQERDGKQVLLMDAELTAGFMSFSESYVSKVTCLPFESVQAVASSSTPLFKTLDTTWRFRPAGHESTLVMLDLTYAFQNPLHAAASAAFFGQISRLTVKAFEERCHQVHGFRQES